MNSNNNHSECKWHLWREFGDCSFAAYLENNEEVGVKNLQRNSSKAKWFYLTQIRRN